MTDTSELAWKLPQFGVANRVMPHNGYSCRINSFLPGESSFPQDQAEDIAGEGQDTSYNNTGSIIAPPSPFVTRRSTCKTRRKSHQTLTATPEELQTQDQSKNNNNNNHKPLHSTTIYIESSSPGEDCQDSAHNYGSREQRCEKQTSNSGKGEENELRIKDSTKKSVMDQVQEELQRPRPTSLLQKKPDGRPKPKNSTESFTDASNEMLTETLNGLAKETQTLKTPKTNGLVSCPEQPNLGRNGPKGDSLEDLEAVCYPAVDAPICVRCKTRETPFFNANCPRCWSLFDKGDATPSHVFAVLRLWVPQVQRHIKRFAQKALDLGCGAKDKDSVTDMTLLHYSVKAGCAGMGNPDSALEVVCDLISTGADLGQKCKWTNMTALHYASYFDVPNILECIINTYTGTLIDEPCSEYHNGTALHIAASNLSEGAVKVLLSHGASLFYKDGLGRTPQECIPSPDQFDFLPGLKSVSSRILRLFRTKMKGGSTQTNEPELSPPSDMYGHGGLQGSGLDIGNRVMVSPLMKTGILRYIGPTEFGTGIWAGVELESPHGRHNGSIKGVVYFKCLKNYGLFTPIHKVSKIPDMTLTSPSRGRNRMKQDLDQVFKNRTHWVHCKRRAFSLSPRRVTLGRVDISKIRSKVAQDISNNDRKLLVGDRVYVELEDSEETGTVQYTGGVHFASGYWIGVELDAPVGFHNGAIFGIQYFECRPQYGVLAVPSKVKKIKSDGEGQHAPTPSAENCHYEIPEHSNEGSLDKLTSSTSSSSIPILMEDRNYFAQSSNSLSRKVSHPAIVPITTSLSSLNLNKCFTARYISSKQKQLQLQLRKEDEAKEPKWLDTSALNFKPSDFFENDPRWLQAGHSVFYKNEIGKVRFIGTVHFAEGTWLGLELKKRRGRHDGKVEGKRYFKCQDGHGVMAPPNKVTVHGLSVAHLIKQELEIKNGSNDLSIV